MANPTQPTSWNAPIPPPQATDPGPFAPKPSPDGVDRRERLTFEEFQRMNRQRCEVAFPMCDDWTLNDWGVALAGEVGELCNLFKKIHRGDVQFTAEVKADLRQELADIITYTDLIMTKLNGDTGIEINRKFNEVSKRVGFNEQALNATHFVLPRGKQSMVKDGDFFRSQGGINSEWGQSWVPVVADNIEDARTQASYMPTVDSRFPQLLRPGLSPSWPR